MYIVHIVRLTKNNLIKTLARISIVFFARSQTKNQHATTHHPTEKIPWVSTCNKYDVRGDELIII